jgi:glutathione peroxidase
MKKLFFLAAVALMIATSCNNQNNKTAPVAEAEPVVEQTSGIYDITVKDINGNDVSLANYKGKVLLIVNVASKCGLTPQYEGLEALYQKYKDQGLEILAFPCNQFLGQEPGTNEEIQSFCSLKYNVTFPLFDKIDVNGEAESPLYTYLKKQAPFKGYPEGTEEFATMLDEIHQKTGTGFDQGDAIRWNFGKFLVSKDGKTILRFEPMVTPDMMEESIQALLNNNE